MPSQSVPPITTGSALSTSPGPASPAPAGSLADRVAALEVGSPKSQTPVPAPAPAGAGMRRSSSAGAGVLDNGTNLGSLSGRKASIGAAVNPFNMERRTSTEGSRRPSRRGSGVVMTPQGAQVVFHTRTDADRDFPHAEKKTIADHLRKFESLLTLTPQRMRMIVHAIEETLDKGLQKEGQVVPMSESRLLKHALLTQQFPLSSLA